jgi:hypothetical protein
VATMPAADRDGVGSCAALLDGGQCGSSAVEIE